MTTTATISRPVDSMPSKFQRYCDLSAGELNERIVAVKREMGDSLLILGQHYQQDEVIRHADLRGDSHKLSQFAAESRTFRAIVFCGVHFMAETADVLSRDEVSVYLPDLAAGCSMADLESVEAGWEDLSDTIDTGDVMPVTYIKSSADRWSACAPQCTASIYHTWRGAWRTWHEIRQSTASRSIRRRPPRHAWRLSECSRSSESDGDNPLPSL
jgi:quinolinate synthase